MHTQKLYTPQFILLCFSYFFFAASFTMIIPELPAYLTSLGGEDYKGLIIGLFTLTAGISRPFSGKLTDTIGRVPVMIIGTLFVNRQMKYLSSKDLALCDTLAKPCENFA